MLICVWLFGTPWTAARRASLSITSSWSLLKVMSIELVMPPNHLILCRPLLLLPSIFSSIRGLLQWIISSYQVAKALEFQLQQQFFQWIFRTYFLYDGLVGSPCNARDSQESSPTPQFKSISSLALSFFMVQLLHPYMSTGKTIVLMTQTFVGLCFSICCLSRS